MDKILIRGLRVYAYHGVKAEEKENTKSRTRRGPMIKARNKKKN